MNSISISRRKFAQLLSAGAACAVVKPALSLAKTAPEVKSQPASPLTRIVRLSSNENPYGPSPHALKAMTDSFNVACRYPDEAAALLSEKLATLNSVNANQILLGDGSGEILKLCADTFTGAQRKLVAGDPTFEAILQHATVNGAEVVKYHSPTTSRTTLARWAQWQMQVLFTSVTRTIPPPVSRRRTN